MPLELSQHETAPGTVAVAITGKLVLGSVGELVVEMVDDLLRQGKRTIVFDLSGVTALDSTGIGQFISSFNRIMAAGGEMRMAAASGHVFQAFHVSLLDKVFRFYPSVEEASRG